MIPIESEINPCQVKREEAGISPKLLEDQGSPYYLVNQIWIYCNEEGCPSISRTGETLQVNPVAALTREEISDLMGKKVHEICSDNNPGFVEFMEKRCLRYKMARRQEKMNQVKHENREEFNQNNT